MKEVSTELVDSKVYQRHLVLGIISFMICIILLLLVGKGENISIILIYKLTLFFDDPSTFRSFAGAMMLVFFCITILLMGKTVKHSLGAIKFSETVFKINGKPFPIENMLYMKFIINSPGVFGYRFSKQGFMNWVEFSIGGKVMKQEFYLQDYAMEDSLILLIGEIKAKYNIPITVEVKAGKPKDSWFESWFGHG